MLFLVIGATIFAVIWAVYLFMKRRSNKRIYFVGPHCSGKTEAIARLLGLPNNTVSSLVSQTVRMGSVEIIECIQNDLSQDFINKFRINPTDSFIFFVKNEEELQYFPDLSGFDIKFVMWKKSPTHTVPNLIYLEESIDALGALIKSR